MFFELSIRGIILRFYLMMLVVIVAGFSGQWWLALFGLPILLSVMVGFVAHKKVQGHH